MGQVFLGYSPGGRAVAVKIIHRELAGDADFRTRFRREVAAATAVSGAYTAPVTAAGPDDDPPWLATVFVPGPSLAAAVAAAGPLPPAAVWPLAAGLAEALQAVHACGLVHRDLKPANVLLATDGPRVIDFGISRALDRTAMTSSGLIVGTPAYMSPEQAEGKRAGQPSDVFSLGGVIVFAATGAGPFGDGTPASTLYRVVHAAPDLAQVPAGLRELAAACLAKAPGDRPGVPELVDAIAGHLPLGAGGPGTFWPVAVTGLIRSYQASLSPPGPDAETPPGQVPGTPGLVSRATAREITAPAALTAPAVTVPARGPAGTAATAPVPAPAPAALTAPPVAPLDPAGPRGPARGLTRRRAVTGIAAAAAALLAGAGWELSHQGAPHHPAASPRPGRGRTAAPVSQPGPAGGITAVPGRPVWQFPASGYAASGLALAGRVLFAGSNDGHVYALDAVTGHQRWAFGTGDVVDSGLVVAGGLVFAGSNNGKVYALRASNGGNAWTFHAGLLVSSALAVVSGVVYGGSLGVTAYAVRASDGTKLWEFTGGAKGQGLAVADGAVYVGGDDGQVHAVDTSRGQPVWTFSAGGPVESGIAVSGGVVYAGSYDHRLYALDASQGSKRWEFSTGGAVNSGIAVAGGVVYAGSADQKIYAVQASNGAKLWEFATGGPVASGIAVAGGVVYAGSGDGSLYALRASHGTRLWEFTAGGPVSSGILVAGGLVYAGSDDGRIYAVRR